MRTREEIIKDSLGTEYTGRIMWTPPEVLEVLLDIRDLLTPKEDSIYTVMVPPNNETHDKGN
jgi:hypothetical protein